MSLRVVYDTQMVAPREEMVPALIINPHNPPPWLRNSTVQPQIIYIQQQQQQNYVQQVQQMDPNQLYLQQYGYQNPQMFIQNYEQIRPMQLVQNVMQVPANPDYSNERIVHQSLPPNFSQTQMNVQNPVPIQQIQNQINTIPVQNQPIPERIDNTQARLTDTRAPNVIQMRPVDPRQMQPNQIQQLTRPDQQFRPNTRMVRPPMPTATVQRRAISSNIVRTPRFAYRPIQPRPRSQMPVQKRFVQSSNTPNIINVTNVGPTPVNTAENANRKRKSESPDEIHKKLNVLAINNSPVLMGQLVNTAPNEIRNDKPPITVTIINNSASQVQKNDLETSTANSTHGLVNQINLAQSLLDKEKLVRNTVYTQARGRILNVKNEIQPGNTSVDAQTDEVMKESNNEATVPNNDAKELKNETNQVENDENIRNVNKRINTSNRNETTDDMKLTDKDYILTHVLDGFVIQESNVAFPIRKPLIEKTIRLGPETIELNPNKEDTADKDLEEHIPKVAIMVEGNKKLEDCNEVVDKDNPFRNLTPAIIKSWTMDKLTAHLDENGWKETSAAFYEHEIDGESLLLVSKSQLLTIGVKEQVADVIMDFMNS